MVTLKEYEAYLKVKRFIDGHNKSEIISRLMGDNIFFFFEDVEKKVGLKSPKLHTPR